MVNLRPTSAWVLAAVLFGPLARADEPPLPSDEATAISAKTFNGYVRHREPDGSFTPESYGIAVGGVVGAGHFAEEKGYAVATADPSIDHTTFAEIGHVIETALTLQKYLPTAAPEQAKLLIVVYWGRTMGTNSFSGVNSGASRDLIDFHNAVLLGFEQQGHLFDAGFNDNSNMMASIRRAVHSRDLTSVEDDRYVVILEAFDFQQLYKAKKPVRLWETRFSLSQRHGDFRDGLPKMAQAAEAFFGTDSKGVSYAGAPDGHVEIGPLRSLGEVRP